MTEQIDGWPKEIQSKADSMMYANMRAGVKGLSLSEIEDAIRDMIVAESETVASTLAAVFYLLL